MEYHTVLYEHYAKKEFSQNRRWDDNHIPRFYGISILTCNESFAWVRQVSLVSRYSGNCPSTFFSKKIVSRYIFECDQYGWIL